MSEHTPTPWKFESEHDHNAEPVFTVRGPNGCLIADCNTIIPTGDHVGCGTAFPEANARLIASAPELSAKAALLAEAVAALRQIAELEGDCEQQEFRLTRFQASQVARAVLSKVREKGD